MCGLITMTRIIKLKNKIYIYYLVKYVDAPLSYTKVNFIPENYSNTFLNFSNNILKLKKKKRN